MSFPMDRHQSEQNSNSDTSAASSEYRAASYDLDLGIVLSATLKPRKKTQAFGVPKDPKILKKIAENAALPLLSLPTEVLARIWKFVIGNRVLHIKTICKKHGDLDDCSCRNGIVSKDKETRAWSTTCCMLPYSEAELFERAKVNPEILAKRDEAEFGNWSNATHLFGFSECVERRQHERKIYLRSNPHNFCKEYVKDINNGTLPLFFCDEHKALDHILPVKVLGLCRQIYIEANPILWSTNTFGFSNARDFIWFMSDRISAQKASITSLLVDLTVNSMQGRGKVTTNAILTSLVSLRTLHLYFSDDSYGVRFRIPGYDSALEIQQQLRRWQSMMEQYRERCIDFKRLPLQEVTVLMPERQISHDYDVHDWYHAEQTKYMESVRDAILDPNGAQDFLQEQASNKAEKQAKAADWKLRNTPCQQASSEQECATLRQAVIDNQRNMKGKTKSSKPQAAACEREHVCITCVQTWGRTVQIAKQCTQPGNCNKAYLSVMFKHQSRPTKTRKLLRQGSDTMQIALEKYIKASRAFKTDSFYLQIGGISLKEEYTVKDLGLQQDSEVEVVDVRIKSPTSTYLAGHSNGL